MIMRGNMNEFFITLGSLSNGWATLTFSDFEKSIKFDVSYTPNDALSDLLDGAIRLLDGRSSEIEMDLEPQVVILALTPFGKDEFIAKIESCEFIGTRLRFARQVLKIFDSFSYCHDQKKYELKWGHPFPTSLIERLRQLIVVCKQS